MQLMASSSNAHDYCTVFEMINMRQHAWIEIQVETPLKRVCGLFRCKRKLPPDHEPSF
jgi:hypothetical protein